MPNLVNISTGLSLTSTPGYVNPPANTNADTFSSIVPFDTINTLADILSTCVNAAGGAADPACTTLFSYTGGYNSLPVGTNGVRGPLALNTADAAIYIAHNPGLPSAAGIFRNNVAALFLLSLPQSPFIPTLNFPPNDWTLVVNYVGGGLGGTSLACAPNTQTLAIDGLGNVWTVNSRIRSLTELNPQGNPLSPSSTVSSGICTKGGWVSGLIPSATGIAFDQSNNAWVSDGANCLAGFSPSGTALPGSPFTAPCPSAGAVGVQVDTNGNIWVAGTTFVTSSTPAGALRSGFPFTNLTSIAAPGVLYQDYAGNMWFIDQGASALNALALSNGAETYASGANYFFPAAPSGAAVGTLDAFKATDGNSGLAMFSAMPSWQQVQVSQLTAPPSPPPTVPRGGPLYPSIPFTQGSVVTDGNSRIYFASGSITQQSPNFVGVYDNAYDQVSPGPNWYTGGTELSSIYELSATAIDQSGNLWVLNRSNYNALMKTGPYGAAYLGTGVGASNVDQIIGVAIPVNPVAVQNAANHTYGAMP